MPLALGEATKTAQFATAGRKRYRFRVRWGVATDTDDREGEMLAESTARPDAASIIAALPHFTGTILQRPPAYSAIKIAGRRAYALARAGEAPELAARPVEIAELRLLGMPDPDHADFEAEVGEGTYIRSLARDLADRRSARSAISPNCAVCRSGVSPRHRRFRWNGPWRSGIVSPLPSISCRSRRRWTTSRRSP